MKQFLLWLFATASSLVTAAQTADTHPHREHGPHVHGTAQLTLALEGKELAIQLRSPADNVIGFEHPPTNETEQRRLQQAIQQLSNASAIFTLRDAALCRAEPGRVTSGLLSNTSHSEQSVTAQTQAPVQNHDEHEHADFTVAYRWVCAQPQALGAIDVKLFALFSGFHAINAEWVSPTGQGAKTLTASDHSVTIL